MFKLNEEAIDWGRCTVDGNVVNWRKPASYEKHLGHKVAGLDGFHINELIRYWLGWL